jgi:hypothetical protein
VKLNKPFVVASAGVVLACASKPTPITVTGDSGDRASLTGTVNGDAIDGTFTTRGSPANTPQTETWQVKRAVR